MSEAIDGTGAGLIAFLDWAGSRGELAPSTAQGFRVTVGKVLAIEPDPDAVDIRQMHPEDLFGRFEVLHRTDYSSGSMGTYRSRFMNAVAMYLAWLDKKPDWKTTGNSTRRPPGKALVRLNGSAGNTGSKAARSKGAGVKATVPPVDKPPADGEPSKEAPEPSPMVPYDLPLRPGLRVRLVLPEVLTRADADRIAVFVSSLAFDQAVTATEGG